MFVVVMQDEEVALLTDDKGMVPVGSNPLDLFRLAIGHPDALDNVINREKFCSLCFNEHYLLCERNFPVEWPEPSHPGTGHL